MYRPQSAILIITHRDLSCFTCCDILVYVLLAEACRLDRAGGGKRLEGRCFQERRASAKKVRVSECATGNVVSHPMSATVVTLMVPCEDGEAGDLLVEFFEVTHPLPPALL